MDAEKWSLSSGHFIREKGTTRAISMDLMKIEPPLMDLQGPLLGIKEKINADRLTLYKMNFNAFRLRIKC
jgi:hypothetical protein